MESVRLGCNHLLYDRACLEIFSRVSEEISLWGQSVDCELCDYSAWTSIIEHGYTKIAVGTLTHWNLQLRNTNGSALCTANDVAFGEQGVYLWNITSNKCSDIRVVSNPSNNIIPWYIAAVALLIVIQIWNWSRRVYTDGWKFNSVCFGRKSNVQLEIENDLGTPVESSSNDTAPLLRRNVQGRVKCLDAFRGATVALMIFVNSGGGRYWYMQHSIWNGVTVSDCVFPWFAWIMGVSISVKVKSELRSCTPRKELFYHILLRSATLILSGIILSNISRNDLRYIRLPGVLQRLGLAYFIVASLETYFMKPQTLNQSSRLQFMEDILACKAQWLFVLFLMVLHTCVTFYLPVPNCPTGYLGPGGLHNHSNYQLCTGGASGYIDRLIIGSSHLYETPTCQKLYDCSINYDPEGLLGTLTTVLCVYFGVQMGVTLLVYRQSAMRLRRWFLWSVFTLVLAVVLSNFPFNNGVIPMNKNLWSLSFVLATSGIAFLLICIFYWLIDHKKWWSGTPFYQAGMNAFLLYALSEIFCDTFPWKWRTFVQTSHTEYLFMNMWATFLWIFISVVLYRNEFFITI